MQLGINYKCKECGNSRLSSRAQDLTSHRCWLGLQCQACIPSYWGGLSSIRRLWVTPVGSLPQLIIYNTTQHLRKTSQKKGQKDYKGHRTRMAVTRSSMSGSCTHEILTELHSVSTSWEPSAHETLTMLHPWMKSHRQSMGAKRRRPSLLHEPPDSVYSQWPALNT